MYYVVYKITNEVNGKIYIGCHKTEDLSDGYMGSGVYLKRAVEKHGEENFTKEYLHVFDKPDDMFEMESTLVNEDFVARKDTYNLKIGGEGGFDYVNREVWTSELRSEHNKKVSPFSNPDKYGEEYVRSIQKDASVKGGKKARELGVGVFNPEMIPGMLGKKHSDDTKRKIGEKSSIHQSGAGNSQYGKPRSDDTKNKISEALRNAPMIECPHCGKQNNSKGAMKRWHFDNCKNR